MPLAAFCPVAERSARLSFSTSVEPRRASRHDNKHGRRAEVVVDDDTCVRALGRAVQEVGPAEPVGRQLARETVGCAL